MLTPKFLEMSYGSKKLPRRTWDFALEQRFCQWLCLHNSSFFLARRLFWNSDVCSWTAECKVVQKMLRLACRRVDISWLVLPHFPVKISITRVFHFYAPGMYPTNICYNNNNNNNIYLLQLGCYPVAVVILHVYKTWNRLLLNLSREGYMGSM